jgi:serine/threonine protein kinase
VESLAGSRLGRFRIKRLIGQGGMGEVYSAVDEHLDREVAIKVLGAAGEGESHRRRFLREARLAARLNHPNIASIHEVGDSDGRLYIVMELLEGQPLRALLTQRRLTPEESLSIARDIARALARAHAGEVIHRDIKPENVFITHPSPDVMLAKVLDFGLAREELTRRRTDEEATATDLTGPGEACGTAGYLAPEQARGLVVDIRADIFSCGAVIYEMLAGKRAFDGKDRLARMLAVVKTQPEPLRSCAPDVDPELAGIVERCLSKAPADRYPDGAALLGALDQLARTTSQRMRAVEPSSRSLEAVQERPSDGPEAPTMAVSAPMRAAPAPSPLQAGPQPVVTAGPSPQSSPMFFRPGAPPPLWPFVVAGAFLVIGVTLIAITLATRPTRPAVALAAGRRSPVVEGARAGERVEGAVAKESPPAAPVADEAKVDEPAASASASASARPHHPQRPSGFTRLPSVGVGPSGTTTPAPSEPPKFGTVRIQQGPDIMTVLVDGEYRRVKDGGVVVSCGRHRIRAGLKDERTVDVPCGGSTVF